MLILLEEEIESAFFTFFLNHPTHFISFMFFDLLIMLILLH